MQHPPRKQNRSAGMRRMTIAVLAALVLAAAFVLALPHIRAMVPPQTLDYEIVENTVRIIAERDAAQIESIRLFAGEQENCRLRMHSGILMLEKNGLEIAVDDYYQQELLKILTGISVQNTVAEDASEVEAHLEAMGLLTPQCKAVVRYADGTQESYEVGAPVPGGTDYYFRWSGSKGIYTCHSGVVEAFSVSPNLLIPFEQPEIYGALVEKITVVNASGECALMFDADGFASLAAPFVYPVSQDAAQTMLTAAENIRLGAFEAALTDETRVDYGLLDPLCAIQVETREGTVNMIDENGALAVGVIPAQKLTYIIGREEGAFFYTCGYGENVYLVSRFLLETLVKADCEQLISRTPAAAGDALLSDIVFETPEKTIEVHISRTESVLANNQLELDAEGNVVYLTSAQVNGREAPQEQLDELLKRLSGFTVEGDIPANAQPETEARWRLTLVEENGRTRVLEGYRLDVFSDAVKVNGVMRHYVYNGAIEVLMAGLE